MTARKSPPAEWVRKILQLRKRLGLNQSEFAARLNYSAMALSRWESGSHEPTAEAYVRMGMTPFGLTPAQDQQLAGLIMWIPGGLFHLGASLFFLSRAIRQPQNVSTAA